MSQEEFLREFKALPPEGQRLVADFIAFLHNRYAGGVPTKKKRRPSIAKEEFIGIWRDREDLKDSSTWVRTLRTSEWGG